MPTPPLDELGVSGGAGVRRDSHRQNDYFDPLDHELRRAGFRDEVVLYRRMRDEDATIGAILTAIEYVCRGVEWHAEPVNDTAAAKEAAEFVDGVLDDMSHHWRDAVGDALSMAQYGFAFVEVVWKLRQGRDQRDPSRRSRYTDGRIGIRKLAGRDPLTLERWDMAPDGGVAAFVQRPAEGNVTEIAIPIERGLLFRTAREWGSPWGRSILRSARRAFLLKRELEDTERVAVDRELCGLPVVYLPEEIQRDPYKRRLYENIVSDLRLNRLAGLTLSSARYADQFGAQVGPEKIRFELLTSGGTRTMDTRGIASSHNRDITVSAVAGFLNLGATSTGSFALSENQTDLFLAAIASLTDGVADTANRHLIPRLWELNGFDLDLLPVLKHGDPAPADVETMATTFERLSRAGAPVGAQEDIPNTVLRAAGLPEIAPETMEEQRAMREAAAAAMQALPAPGEGDEEREEEAAEG